ncbi:MAG: hypothetical protein NTX53_13655, partial [candidate division WOR-3 bacterium]|nr:hypothetical protein [candidate division WOR-3 bacterium]
MAPRKSLIINGRKNDDLAAGGFSAGLLGARPKSRAAADATIVPPLKIKGLRDLLPAVARPQLGFPA